MSIYISDSIYAAVPLPLDSKTANIVQQGAYTKIESIGEYLARVDYNSRYLGMIVSILSPSGTYQNSTLDSKIDNAEITVTLYAFMTGKSDLDFLPWGGGGGGGGDEIDPTVSSYTKSLTSATVLLNQIKTVDGPSSGLDADLLDGLHKEDFALADHKHYQLYQPNGINPFVATNNSGVLSITGTTSTTNLKITGGAINGYYWKCTNADGSGTWAPVNNSQVYKGVWNASTNTPTIQDGIGTAGWWYRVVVSGTWNGITFNAGDDVLYNGTTWERVPGQGYVLAPATDTVLGGIKVGSLLSITLDGILSHSTGSWVAKTSLTGKEVISNLSVDNYGHLTNWTTRTLPDQEITFTASGDVSGTVTGTTSLSPSLTVQGLQTKVLPALSIGYLRYNGTAFQYINETYSLSSHTHSQYITDAPSDNGLYGRKNGNWEAIITTGSNNYTTGISFSSLTGVFTLTRDGLSDLTTSIDGRYSLLGHTHSYEPILGNPLVDGYLLSSTAAGVRSWVAPYAHPTQPASDTGSLTGANIISRIAVNTLGHTTAVETRVLTLANLGYSGATNADYYGSWNFQSQNSAGTQIGVQSIASGNTATIKAGSNVTLSQTGGIITINNSFALTNNTVPYWNGTTFVDSGITRDSSVTYIYGNVFRFSQATENFLWGNNVAFGFLGRSGSTVEMGAASGSNTLVIRVGGNPGITLTSGAITVAALGSTKSRLVVASSTGVLSGLTDGTAGQVLTTDGLGNYSWSSSSGGGSNYTLDGISSAGGATIRLLKDAVVTSPVIPINGSGGATVSWDGTKIVVNSSDTNWYPTGITFNNANGILQITGSGMPSISTSLDNRYSLLSHSHTEFGKVTLDGGLNYYPLSSFYFNVSGGVEVIPKIVDTVTGGQPLPVSSSGVATALSSYQLLLVSGTNIKTINGSSILGSGNLSIPTGVTNNAVTFNNSGSGAASGTTFDGSVARTISYNTIGAAALAGSISQAFSVSQLTSNGPLYLPSSCNVNASGGYVRMVNGSYSFSMDSSGNGMVDGTMQATNFILSSDRRLKENIKPIETSHQEIEFVEFNMIGSEEKRYGVIAQQVEEIAPELVRTNEDGKKSVAYIDLLIRKIAELEARIKVLENG